ncbi:MAG: FAD-dependent oxidoreductase [Coriobacteriales bacterium]|jgi:2,4-dienoyl-CoA reductase-like NADH-dependent reductase (Old Yellow Enzyme family)/thioredoxin reductase
MYEKLFSPCKIGNMEIRNRIVMTSMGNGYSNGDGIATDTDVNYYATRAKGGVGLIMTECVTVEHTHGGGNDKQMSLGYDEVIPSMQKLTEAVHKYGAKIGCEIYHSGRQGVAGEGETLPAPSAQECLLVHQPVHEMTKDEINEMVQKFIDAAVRVKKSGFDAVEVHGAHGYLLSEFMSPYTNHRTDEYGGSRENRLRIVKEIIDGIREACGPDYPIIVRYSADEYLRFNGIEDGITIDEGVEIGKMLASFGIDALDVSAGIYETMNEAWEPVGFQQGWKITNAAEVKKNVDIPVIGCSVIRDPAYAEMVLEKDYVDFVGSARQFHCDPEWPNKAKDGRTNEIRKCISCLSCMESLMAGQNVICAVNPEAGLEGEYANIKKDGDGRVVVIVGAGPAGMEAAHVLARRGFKPIILEAKSQVGGQLEYANKPPMKDKMNWFIEYQRAMMEKHGIQIMLDTPATVETLKHFNPYKIIWAAGSSPVKPRSIEGLDLPCVVTPPDVLSGKVKFFGKKICVVGSGMTGIETAELLAEQGNQVDVYEMADDIGPGMHFQNLIDVLGRTGAHGVGLFPKHMLVKVTDGAAEFKNTETEETETATFDYLVLSLGVRGNQIPEDISAAFPDIINVGDSEKAGRLSHATATAYKAAFEL